MKYQDFCTDLDCKTVRIFVYSSTLYARTVKQKQKTESETGERRMCQIYKEDVVVNRFLTVLTVQRHF